MRDEHVDVLISRLACDEAGPEGWREFERLAASDPRLWHELAVAQRDQVALVQMVSDAGDIADTVAVPFREAPASHQDGARPWRPWAAVVTGWSGWAVAAALGAALFVFRPGGPAATPPGAGLQPVSSAPRSADEAFRSYLELGRAAGLVVGEMPTKVLLETRPGPEGQGYEVIYLRGVLERMTVPDLYRFEQQTEQGSPALVRWEGLPGESM